jgi:hypothetical protein
VAAGANQQVQFNDSGAFGANPNFTYNKATSVLTVLGDVDSNRVVVQNPGQPPIYQFNTSAPANTGKWFSTVQTADGSWNFTATNDAETKFNNALQVTRNSGTSNISAMVYGNNSDNPQHTFFGNDVHNGAVLFQKNLGGVLPFTTSLGGGSIAWNFSGGSGELDFINNWWTAGTSFVWYQQTAANAVTQLMNLGTSSATIYPSLFANNELHIGGPFAQIYHQPPVGSLSGVVANSSLWTSYVSGATWNFQARNDAQSNSNPVLAFARTSGTSNVTTMTYGNSIDQPTHAFNGPLTITGNYSINVPLFVSGPAATKLQILGWQQAGGAQWVMFQNASDNGFNLYNGGTGITQIGVANNGSFTYSINGAFAGFVLSNPTTGHAVGYITNDGNAEQGQMSLNDHGVNKITFLANGQSVMTSPNNGSDTLVLYGVDQPGTSPSTSGASLRLTTLGATAGSGGILEFGAAGDAWKFATIKGYATNGSNNTQGNISFATRRVATDATLTEALNINSNGSVIADTDLQSLGTLTVGGNFLLSGGSGTILGVTNSAGVFEGTSGQTTDINTATGGLGGLWAYNPNASTNGGGAFMTFHRGGSYAAYFGLDSNNILSFGGWSAGANKYAIAMGNGGTYTMNITGHASSDLPLTGGTLTGNLDIQVTSAAYANNANAIAGLVINNPSGAMQSAVEFNTGGNVRGRIRSDYVGNMNYTANGGVHNFFTGGDSGAVGSTDILSISSAGIDGLTGHIAFNSGTSGTIDGTPTTYGAISISGSLGQWSGIHFKSSNSNMHLMVSDSTVTTRQSGMYSTTLGAWDWYFTNGTLTAGTIPAANVSAGTFGAGSYTVTGTLNAAVLNATSDRNKKTNITKISDAHNIIASLNGVRFNWKDNGNASAGLIAQDVEAVMPELVSTADNGTKSLNYNGVTGALVEAVKDLMSEIKALRAEIELLKAK